MKILRMEIVSLLFIILFSFSPINSFSGEGNPYKSIVFFGDSLSDNGNLYWYDWGYLPKSPPYFEGRFSNGYVWTEHAAKYFYDKNYTKTFNYAFGGETVLYHGPMSGYLPYNLNWSINSFLLRSMWQDRSSSLFVIWIGANDYLPGHTELERVTTDVVAGIKYNIEKLISRGAKNFLIINLPNLGDTPYGKDSTLAESLNMMTLLHNNKLDDAVTELVNSYKQVNLQLIDINRMFVSIVRDPDWFNKKYKINITNMTHACWPGNYSYRADTVDAHKLETALLQKIKANYKQKISIVNNNVPTQDFDSNIFVRYILTSPALLEVYRVSEKNDAGLSPCQKPNEYLFWDKVHPTADIHRLLSHKMIQVIEANFTPADDEMIN